MKETNTKETSKTNREIFEQKFVVEELLQSPMLCAEAIGYLKALTEYFPSEKKWADSYITTIMTVLLFYAL